MKWCANCGAENPAGLKFCEQCAAPFKKRCARCGFENSPVARFCGQCAGALTGNAQAASARAPLPQPIAPEIRVTPEQPDTAPLIGGAIARFAEAMRATLPRGRAGGLARPEPRGAISMARSCQIPQSSKLIRLSTSVMQLVDVPVRPAQIETQMERFPDQSDGLATRTNAESSRSPKRSRRALTYARRSAESETPALSYSRISSPPTTVRLGRSHPRRAQCGHRRSERPVACASGVCRHSHRCPHRCPRLHRHCPDMLSHTN